MSIQTQVLGIWIGMDIIVTNTDEFCKLAGSNVRSLFSMLPDMGWYGKD